MSSSQHVSGRRDRKGKGRLNGLACMESSEFSSKAKKSASIFDRSVFLVGLGSMPSAARLEELSV
jgi:hypothetical protein